MFKRISVAMMIAAMTTSVAVADQLLPAQSYQLAQVPQDPDFNGSIQNGDSDRPGYRPGYRPGAVRDRYYCVLSSGSYCSAGEQRVGGVCRCPNQIGSGRVIVR
ncbi:hypothetical protein J5J10_13705 [Ciceribacter sp. L1K23]|uniref:hypothetical protein n=1 Tax=unclassified Ciceribacter TaxID=2628820 RepID=UPI001ABDCDE4|nr:MULTISPECIES: hypothetical protein [unclassified Ciceribacter]MBO3759116.1 hypothetical protein [Ciceribacter sp. L1K22]MBR0556737.1 hypothetical protein [Ciceribacter sp. L1K23]